MPDAFVFRNIPFVDADTAEVVDAATGEVNRDYIRPGLDIFPATHVVLIGAHKHVDIEGPFEHRFVARASTSGRKLRHIIFQHSPVGQKRRVWSKSYP